MCFFFFFQAEDGIRDGRVTGVQTCALPISGVEGLAARAADRANGEGLDAGTVGRDSGVGAGHLEQRDARGAERQARVGARSEERRVGKECRSRWSPEHEKKKRGKRKEREAE